MNPAFTAAFVNYVETKTMNTAERYISRIRNKAKAQYAMAYLQFLRDGEVTEPPESTELSYMGAQSVRLQLRELVS